LLGSDAWNILKEAHSAPEKMLILGLGKGKISMKNFETAKNYFW
jgi:hypothetical protein